MSSSTKGKRARRSERLAKRNKCLVLAIYETTNNDVGQVLFYRFDKTSSRPLSAIVEPDEKNGRVYQVDPSLVNTKPIAALEHWHLNSGYVSSGGRIYCAGGRRAGCSYSNCFITPLGTRRFADSVSSLTLCEDSPRTLPDMNTPRGSPRLLILRGTIFAVGGKVLPKDDPSFIEFHIPGAVDSGWVPIGFPSLPFVKDPLYLRLNAFVCAAIKFDDHSYKILIGSESYDFFLGLPLEAKVDKKGHLQWNWLSWEDTRIPYNRMLDSCQATPFPGYVSQSKRLMMWLDTYGGTTLIVLDYYSHDYSVIDLAAQGVLPSPRCHHYFARLVSLDDDRDDLVIGLIWTDKHLYIALETPELIKEMDMTEYRELRHPVLSFGGHNFTTFRLIIDLQADRNKIDDQADRYKIQVISRERCITRGSSTHLQSAFFV